MSSETRIPVSMVYLSSRIYLWTIQENNSFPSILLQEKNRQYFCTITQLTLRQAVILPHGPSTLGIPAFTIQPLFWNEHGWTGKKYNTKKPYKQKKTTWTFSNLCPKRGFPVAMCTQIWTTSVCGETLKWQRTLSRYENNWQENLGINFLFIFLPLKQVADEVILFSKWPIKCVGIKNTEHP